MQNNNTLAYQAKTLATKAVILADNLAAQLDKLSPQYQELLRVDTLRTATTATTQAASAYESNYDNKKMLATTAARNLRDNLNQTKATQVAQKTAALTPLRTKRDDLKRAYTAACAEVRTAEEALAAAHKQELATLTREGKAVVTQNETAAKAFGDDLRKAYTDLRRLYLEYKNLVEGAALKLKDPNLVNSVLPREAVRVTHRATQTGAPTSTAVADTAAKANGSAVTAGGDPTAVAANPNGSTASAVGGVVADAANPNGSTETAGGGGAAVVANPNGSLAAVGGGVAGEAVQALGSN